MSIALTGFGNDLHAARVYRALGATANRVEILRTILHNGETSAGWLMDQFALTRNGVLHHLNALTAEGLLSTRHDTHPRGAGPITYWSANRDEVRVILDDFMSHLLNDR